MNILVPVDGTEHSLRAVEFLTTRTDLLGAAPKITIFFSQHPVPQRMITSLEPLTIKDYYAEEAESLFASVRALLGDTKLNIEMHYAVGSPAEEIVKEADLVDADLAGHGLGREAGSGQLVSIAAAFYAAPVHRADQCFGGQIDGKLAALLDQVVAESLRPDADGDHAGLGADGAGPADRDQVGRFQPAAGDQHRRLRVQEGAAFPALFAHP